MTGHRDRDAVGTPARDPGLQPERTSLAWSRTGLAFAVVDGLLLHAGFMLHRSVGWTLLGFGVLAACGLYAAGRARRRALRDPHRVPTAPPRALVGMAAALVVVTGVLAVFVVTAG